MRRITLLALAAIASFLWIGLPGSISTAEARHDLFPILAGTNNILTMRVTAYASTPDETDDTPFITANGTTVHDGIVASNILPFGTKIQIPELFGDKIFTVEDRMNQRIKNTIDIWMSDKMTAISFGVAHASIVVLGDTTSSTIGEATSKNKEL